MRALTDVVTDAVKRREDLAREYQHAAGILWTSTEDNTERNAS